MLKGTDQEINDLDLVILLMYYYWHKEHMLIDMESTTLLYREVNIALMSYRSLDDLNLS